MTKLNEKWEAGQPTLGLWSTLGSPLATEILSRAGFDYVCIDNQHGTNDYASTLAQLQAVDCGGTPAIVRVPWNEQGIIGKMLDAGADGIIIPMVNSAYEAEAAVRSCRYAPQGSRSVGPVRAAVRIPDYLAIANAHVACIPMIETAEAINNIDDILAVPGIDAAYVGPADLAVSLGFAPGSAENEPAFINALDAVVTACGRHGVVPGIHSTTAMTAQRLKIGFRMITVTSDAVAIRSGLPALDDVVAGQGAPGTGSIY